MTVWTLPLAVEEYIFEQIQRPEHREHRGCSVGNLLAMCNRVLALGRDQQGVDLPRAQLATKYGVSADTIARWERALRDIGLIGWTTTRRGSRTRRVLRPTATLLRLASGRPIHGRAQVPPQDGRPTSAGGPGDGQVHVQGSGGASVPMAGGAPMPLSGRTEKNGAAVNGTVQEMARAVERLTAAAHRTGVTSRSLPALERVFVSYIHDLQSIGWNLAQAEDRLLSGLERIRAEVQGERDPGAKMRWKIEGDGEGELGRLVANTVREARRER